MGFRIEPNTRSIDEAEVRAMLAAHEAAIEAAQASDVDGVIDLECLCSGTLRGHEGDLAVDELHLVAEGPSLVIQGNLTVRGALIQDFRAGSLLVLGNLEARDIATTGQIFVSGDLTAAGTVFGSCTNYGTHVLGTTRARVLVSAKEHYFCMYGGHAIERIVDVYGDTPNLEAATDSADALVDGIDGGFDEVAVAERLRRGESLLARDG